MENEKETSLVACCGGDGDSSIRTAVSVLANDLLLRPGRPPERELWRASIASVLAEPRPPRPTGRHWFERVMSLGEPGSGQDSLGAIYLRWQA